MGREPTVWCARPIGHRPSNNLHASLGQAEEDQLNRILTISEYPGEIDDETGHVDSCLLAWYHPPDNLAAPKALLSREVEGPAL